MELTFCIMSLAFLSIADAFVFLIANKAPPPPTLLQSEHVRHIDTDAARAETRGRREERPFAIFIELSSSCSLAVSYIAHIAPQSAHLSRAARLLTMAAHAGHVCTC